MMGNIVWIYFFCVAVLCFAGKEGKVNKPVTCKRTYTKKGCFVAKDNNNGMDSIVNDRDFKGIELNWGKFAESIHSLLCRCSKKARDDGYSVIAIRFWAECWAGKGSGKLASIMKENAVSDKCANHKFGKCNDTEPKECVGKDYSIYLYSLEPEEEKRIWSSWTACSEPCGAGVRTRTSTCKGDVKLSGRTLKCNNNVITDEEQCNNGVCPTCSWGNGFFAISAAGKITIKGAISNKEDCLNKCLRKRVIHKNINAINFFSDSSAECECLKEVAASAQPDFSAKQCRLV